MHFKLFSTVMLLVWGVALFSGPTLFVTGHVSLTFPPSRRIPIDFLNTFWSKGPCGMPQGHVKTSLLAGQALNVTWHLGYAHQGGYRLELLDRNENKIMDLTSNDGSSFFKGHSTAQSHYVDIPENATCRDCVIRLLREVPEFSPSFQFISCADVSILNKHAYVETCSGHGHVISGRCTCYAKYWGDRCQYQDECDTDIDCNGRGRCIHLGGSSHPRRQCFCPPSHFGTRCTQQNPSSLPRPSALNLQKHVRVKLDDRFTMYFKVLLGTSQYQDEVEFVMQINGTSYGAIGWRPTSLGPICKSFPFYSNALRVNSIRRKRSPQAFTITKSIDHSQGSPASSSQSFSFSTSGSNANRGRVVSSSQTSASPTVYHTYDVDSRAVSGGRKVLSAPQQNIQIVELSNSRRKSQQATSQPSPPVQPQRTSSQSAPQSPQPSFTPAEWADRDPFTPMDCSDIIVGSARGDYHRVRDTYARGRHTPLPDYEWGGRDDLTGAVGFEYNGVTTIAFRRRMDANDGPDHSIRGEMQVIWARGQEPGEAVTLPQHQLQPGNSVVSSFYTRDELKYHGLGSQRGFLFIDFDAVRKEYQSGAYSQ